MRPKSAKGDLVSPDGEEATNVPPLPPEADDLLRLVGALIEEVLFEEHRNEHIKGTSK